MSTATTLKRVAISHALEAQPELAELVLHANETLAEVLGQSCDRIDVHWDYRRDHRERPLLELRLKDDVTGREATAEFAADEFSNENEWHLRWRLHSLWGELLAARSDQAMKALRAAVKRLDGEQSCHELRAD
jgi:hypothetical protein